MKRQIQLLILATLACFGLKAQPAGNPFGGKSTCQVEPNYHFKGALKMNMIIRNPKMDSINSDIDYFISDSAKRMAIVMNMAMGKGAKITAITSMKDSQVVMLMDMGTMKMSSCHNMNEYKAKGKKHVAPYFEFADYKSTGRSKTICGYLCKEYVLNNDTLNIGLWITKDLKDWDFVAVKMGGSNQSDDARLPKEMNGFALEFTYSDKLKQSSIHGLANHVDTKKETNISTEGYTLR